MFGCVRYYLEAAMYRLRRRLLLAVVRLSIMRQLWGSHRTRRLWLNDILLRGT